MYCLQTLKTQEFRTKDFVVRSAHSIEHKKCKYCHQQKQKGNSFIIFLRLFFGNYIMWHNRIMQKMMYFCSQIFRRAYE